MPTTLPVSKTDFIGDSLQLMNQNYANLDKWVYNIKLSAESLWQPLFDLFLYNQDGWDNALTLAKQNSATWISFASTVETNSAKWLKPLTIFYPGIYNSKTSKPAAVVEEIGNWLNNHFPVTNPTSTIPLYAENQEAIITNFSFTEEIISKQISKTDPTTCRTGTAIAYAQCATYGSGIGYCSNGDLNCNGLILKCPQTKTVYCQFDFPYENISDPETLSVDGAVYYEEKEGPPWTGEMIAKQTPASVITASALQGEGRIQMKLYIDYTNRRENTALNSLRFKVSNCAWVFDSVVGNQITTPQTVSPVIHTPPIVDTPPPPTTANFVIDITSNTYNFSTKQALIDKGWDQKLTPIVTINIKEGVIVGSSSTNKPAFTVESLPFSSKITINNYGYIVGAGGVGAGVSNEAENGGDALQINSNVSIKNVGVISGGGGGGGSIGDFMVVGFQAIHPSAAGSGGAGSLPGAGGSSGTTKVYVVPGKNGTLLSGGSSSDSGSLYTLGGAGGNLGLNGSSASSLVNFDKKSPGNAGYYIVGNSYVSWSNIGDVRGPAI